MSQKEKRKNIYFYNDEIVIIEKIINRYKKIYPTLSESNIMKNIIFNNLSLEKNIKKITMQNKQILEEINFNGIYIRMLMELVIQLSNNKEIPALFWKLDPLKNQNMLFSNKKLEEIRKQIYEKIKQDFEED